MSTCVKGSRCNFAHGTTELRQKVGGSHATCRPLPDLLPACNEEYTGHQLIQSNKNEGPAGFQTGDQQLAPAPSGFVIATFEKEAAPASRASSKSTQAPTLAEPDSDDESSSANWLASSDDSGDGWVPSCSLPVFTTDFAVRQPALQVPYAHFHTEEADSMVHVEAMTCRVNCAWCSQTALHREISGTNKRYRGACWSWWEAKHGAAGTSNVDSLDGEHNFTIICLHACCGKPEHAADIIKDLKLDGLHLRIVTPSAIFTFFVDGLVAVARIMAKYVSGSSKKKTCLALARTVRV